MALRNIRNYYDEDTILRKISKKVKIIDERILTLLNDMADTMYQANGAGLAAPQIGILAVAHREPYWRIAVMSLLTFTINQILL